MKVRLPLAETSSDVKDSKDGLYSKVENKIEVETKINHQGEVNKARAMPQVDKYNIIASKTVSGEVHIFDYFKHPPKPTDNQIKPEMRLTGHSKEGYGLNWSTRRVGYLLSGADDHKICLWDINSSASHLSPLKIVEEHKGVVEDVSWNKQDENLFASCGDDRKLMLHDLRQERPISIVEAHSQEVNSVDFNPFEAHLLLTASNDKTVSLWDIRNLAVKVHTFEQHRNDVVAARWNPSISTMYASFSADRRVNVWDLSKVGASQSVADQEDGPPELLVYSIIIFSSPMEVIQLRFQI